MTLETICQKAIPINGAEGLVKVKTYFYLCSINQIRCVMYAKKEECSIYKYIKEDKK